MFTNSTEISHISRLGPSMRSLPITAMIASRQGGPHVRESRPFVACTIGYGKKEQRDQAMEGQSGRSSWRVASCRPKHCPDGRPDTSNKPVNLGCSINGRVIGDNTKQRLYRSRLGSIDGECCYSGPLRYSACSNCMERSRFQTRGSFGYPSRFRTSMPRSRSSDLSGIHSEKRPAHEEIHATDAGCVVGVSHYSPHRRPASVLFPLKIYALVFTGTVCTRPPSSTGSGCGRGGGAVSSFAIGFLIESEQPR